ncbi:hypothetical protein ACUUL3_16225 [Thiovibrio sp. JS02]
MPPSVEGRLIPIMREGIDIIKMIFFKKLKETLIRKYPERDPAFAGKLSGAMVNRIFAGENQEAPFLAFATENAGLIAKELSRVAVDLEEMRIPLTDALRMQTLCDHQEGSTSTATLQAAEQLGILLLDRDLPLPHSFIQLARKLGSAFGLIIPPLPAEEPISH